MSKIKIGVLLAIVLCFLSGCGGVEPEEQEFPLVVYLDSSDSLPKVDDYVNYYHVKAIVFSDKLLADEDQLTAVLSYLESQDEFSRNVLVFSTDSDSLLQLENLDSEIEAEGEESDSEGVPESMGFMLSELEEKQEWYDADTETTLGDLYNQWHSADELLLIPGLTINDADSPEISYFTTLECFEYKGPIDLNLGILSYFIRGLSDEIQFQDIEGYDFKLQEIHAKEELVTSNGRNKVVITLKGEASVTNQNVTEEDYVEYAQQLLNTYLNSYLKDSVSSPLDQQVDLSNSFKKLAAWDRTLYKEYADQPLEWANEISIKIDSQIKVR